MKIRQPKGGRKDERHRYYRPDDGKLFKKECVDEESGSRTEYHHV